MATLTAETGGFAWSTAWLPEGTTWDDNYAWADVAAWEANPTIPLVIGEAAGVGSFNVSGQAITEDLLEKVDVGTFVSTGFDAGKGVTELASGQFFTFNGQDINEVLLEAIDFGSFAFSGQAANKSLSENLVYGNFVFNGRPINEAISERAEVGTFVLTGNAVNEALLERIDVANFNVAGQPAAKGLTHPFGFGEFFTNLGGIEYNNVWADEAYWLDTDYWNDGDNVDIDITERIDVGVFSLAGQNSIKRIRRLAGGTTYSLVGIDSFIRKPRYEYDRALVTATLLTGNPNIAVVIDDNNLAVVDSDNNTAILDRDTNDADFLMTKNGYN